MKAKLLAKKMLLLISLGVCTDAATQMLPRYFSFVTQESITAIPQEFVFETNDPALIDKLKRMLTDPYMGRDVHIGGIVLRGRAPYNEAWNFFIMPGSAFLFDSNPEACNVSPMDLEDRIDELGPMLAWCPWTSRLVREVRVDGQRTGLAR